MSVVVGICRLRYRPEQAESQGNEVLAVGEIPFRNRDAKLFLKKNCLIRRHEKALSIGNSLQETLGLSRRINVGVKPFCQPSQKGVQLLYQGNLPHTILADHDFAFDIANGEKLAAQVCVAGNDAGASVSEQLFDVVIVA